RAREEAAAVEAEVEDQAAGNEGEQQCGDAGLDPPRRALGCLAGTRDQLVDRHGRLRSHAAGIIRADLPLSRALALGRVAGTPVNNAPHRLIEDVEFGEDVVAFSFVNLYGCTIGDRTR